MRLTRAYVLEVVREKLAQIRKENGYSCDIGQKVEDQEGMESEPKEDCVAVIGGVEVFGKAARPGIRPRTLTLYLSAMFYEDDPLTRANLSAEDFLVWLDKNLSLGVPGMSVTVETMNPTLDPTAQLAEMLVTLQLSY